MTKKQIEERFYFIAGLLEEEGATMSDTTYSWNIAAMAELAIILGYSGRELHLTRPEFTDKYSSVKQKIDWKRHELNGGD